MYLVFLRYCSYFFGSIGIINIVFIILFCTGDPLPSDDFRKNPETMHAMQALTILNITGTPWKLILCFLNCMITTTAMMVNLIMVYNQKYADRSDHKETDHNVRASYKMTELDVKSRTI